jgi:hypothetical protein
MKIIRVISSLVLLSFWATSVQAGLIRIAENDGSVNFNSSTYANGYGSFGDANFITSNLASYDALGTNVTIKVSMGAVVDYFKPAFGYTLLQMLTSNIHHTWSASETGTFVTPLYFSSHLGGSSSQWPLNNAFNDDRQYLTFWGSNSSLTGGCCDLNYNSGQTSWGQAFTIDAITAVPEPSTLAIFALGIMGLASRRFKKQS